MNSLNFLKLQPLANWLDYFLDRSKFFELLGNAEENRNTITSLLDQFIEQALNAEREQIQLELKEMDEEDVLYMRHKVDELWMCAICTLAALHWDLDTLAKCSNVYRIRALWNRLCGWVFEDSQPLTSKEIGNAGDAFARFASSADISTLNSQQLFTLWLYARWILLMDVQARFPLPAVKPTVSNPYNQPDSALQQAERLSQITAKIRQNVPLAVNLLNQFLDVSNGNALKGYGAECFHVRLDKITSTSLEVLRNESTRPNFAANCVAISRVGFQSRTIVSLIASHFAARHFRTAKLLLKKIMANLETAKIKSERAPFLSDLLRVDKDELDNYQLALDFRENATLKLSEHGDNIRPDVLQARHIIQAALTRRHPSVAGVLRGLMDGMCVSKRVLNLMKDSRFRMDLLEKVSHQFWSLNFNTASRDSDNLRRLNVYCALYFICLISPDFADTLMAHPRLRALRKWRGLATTVETPLLAHPRNDELKSFLSNETPFWNVMVSFDLDVIRDGLARLQHNFRLPIRHRFSDVTGETILNNAGPIYNQVVLHLWKLEQLAQLNFVSKWKMFVNGFVTNVIQSISTPETNEMLAYDMIRIETEILNRLLFKQDNLNEYKLRNIDHIKIVSAFMQRAIQMNFNVFTRFALSLSVFLLNNRHYKVIALTELTEHPCFKTPYTDMARNLAVYFLRMFELHDLAGANMSLSAFWTAMWPTFDATVISRRQIPVISQAQFLDFIQNLKEPNVLDFFFSLFAHLINVRQAGERERTASQVNSSTPLATLITANQRIVAPSESIWQQMTFDFTSLHVDFVKIAMEKLCANAMLVNAINLHWLRICGDFYFLCENYKRAVTYYLEILIAVQNKFGGAELGDAEFDVIITKITAACSALRMPTLATIVGQLRRNVAPHYQHVDWILQNTPNTVDAGYAYFPLIADLTLFEHMTAVYNKYGMTTYAQKLLKIVPTKSMNVNNSPKVLDCEIGRRKQRFLGVLFNQFFRNTS